MLLAQTRRDRKETRARHSVRALNMKHTLEFVFIERYGMLFFQLTKWPHNYTQSNACFVNLENGCLRACRVAYNRPVRPLILMYNSMIVHDLIDRHEIMHAYMHSLSRMHFLSTMMANARGLLLHKGLLTEMAAIVHFIF
jgi:hypothetical protein